MRLVEYFQWVTAGIPRVTKGHHDPIPVFLKKLFTSRTQHFPNSLLRHVVQNAFFISTILNLYTKISSSWLVHNSKCFMIGLIGANVIQIFNSSNIYIYINIFICSNIYISYFHILHSFLVQVSISRLQTHLHCRKTLDASLPYIPHTIHLRLHQWLERKTDPSTNHVDE